jgi:hypothetical protein
MKWFVGEVLMFVDDKKNCSCLGASSLFMLLQLLLAAARVCIGAFAPKA